MAEHIHCEPHDETAWVCACGNQTHTDGFMPCDQSGDTEEPTGDGSWEGLYRCERCLRIIDQRDRRVVGLAPQRYRFIWQGIEVEARYWPVKWTAIFHLEIQSIAPERAPLPITDTGYRSHFMLIGTVEAHGGDVVAQVIAWLDKEAAKPAWRAHVEASRQGKLF